jgi:hypothetical protein
MSSTEEKEARNFISSTFHLVLANCLEEKVPAVTLMGDALWMRGKHSYRDWINHAATGDLIQGNCITSFYAWISYVFQQLLKLCIIGSKSPTSRFMCHEIGLYARAKNNIQVLN